MYVATHINTFQWFGGDKKEASYNMIVLLT